MFSNGGKRLFSELVPEKGQQKPFKENQVKSMLSGLFVGLMWQHEKRLVVSELLAWIKSYINGVCVIS